MIYRIASMTKTFTATLLMQLTEEGKVGLDDPADKYVPEIKSLPGYSKSRAFTQWRYLVDTPGYSQICDSPGGGMMIVRDQYLTLIGHDGSDPGYTSEYLIEPTSGDAIILMRNIM